MPKGLLVVMSGPSGVGKTTIAHRVQQAVDGVFSVSATTRACGPGEVDGEDYHFVSMDTFQSMQRDGDFLESAQVFSRDAYGTPKAPVLDDMANGRVVLLDIDVQGAAQVRRAVPEACMIFVLPPDEDTLRARLTNRGRDDANAIERRLAEARTEIEAAQAPGLYDCFVVNDDLDKATQSVLETVNRHRRQAAEA